MWYRKNLIIVLWKAELIANLSVQLKKGNIIKCIKKLLINNDCVNITAHIVSWKDQVN